MFLPAGESVTLKWRGTQNVKGKVCKALLGGSIPSRASTTLYEMAKRFIRRFNSVCSSRGSIGAEPKRSVRTLQRYRRPQTSSLLPWKRGRKPNESLLGDEREALLNTCIDECYLRPERPSLAALHLEVRRRFAERVLAVPTCRTVRWQVEAVDARTALRRQRTKTLPILVVNGSFALLAGYGCACEIERPRYGTALRPHQHSTRQKGNSVCLRTT
ncbi:MAG: Mu binding, gamma subdomain [Acidobacteriaceae bacterium]|nr:Mu binding, gamma subdomain [Acidobacteriaceae bacterium]